MIEKLERYAQGAFGVQAYENGNYCMYAATRAREDVLLEAAKESLLYTDCSGECDSNESCPHHKLREIIREIEATR